jgi:hypothetical protein
MIARCRAKEEAKILIAMRRFILFFIGATSLLAFIPSSSLASPDRPRAASHTLYLPLIATPAESADDVPALQNPSFEDGWTDLPPTAGYLINQQPHGWRLNWVEPGQPLYDAGDLAHGVPECVHKLADQLPPDEQPGGPDALILEGETTYKIFSAASAFGAELRQTITGLPSGSTWRLVIPMRVHLYGETDPYGAETGVWVEGVGRWVTGETMGDRTWYRHTLFFTAPDDGAAELLIRVKSKWDSPKDFFIDDIRLEPALAR